MISHEHKCIFIHIPKCAGTSIERALGHIDTHVERGVQDHRSIRMIEQPLMNLNIFSSIENFSEVLRRIHHNYRAVTNPHNKFTVTKEQYDSYYKFTIIRNPWARVFSWYKNVMRDEIHKKNLKITGHLSLNEFLRLYAGKGMMRPQTYWIKSFSGSTPLDYIGRFETLIEDFHEICKAIQLSQKNLPHIIKGTNEDYREHFNQDSINFTGELYREEIEMFDYSFE